MSSIKVKYIGKKLFAIDNVAGSGKLWNGNGDVQEVTPAQAKRLIKHEDQWALVDPADLELALRPLVVRVEDEDGDEVSVNQHALIKPLEKMSRAELVAYALTRFNKVLSAKAARKLLLDQIEELEESIGAVSPDKQEQHLEVEQPQAPQQPQEAQEAQEDAPSNDAPTTGETPVAGEAAPGESEAAPAADESASSAVPKDEAAPADQGADTAQAASK